MKNKKSFTPALKYEWLSRLYDPIIKLTDLEEQFKKYVLNRANIQNNDAILDFGCGTGTLTIMAKKQAPKAVVHGIDIDPSILQIAQDKVDKSGYHIFLKLYEGDVLPYPQEMFDNVLSTLVFHHLSSEQKWVMLSEIYKTLKWDGELYIADFGEAENMVMRGMFLAIQLVDGFANTADNVKGKLPEQMEAAGFRNITEYKQINTIVGTIAFYKATKLREV